MSDNALKNILRGMTCLFALGACAHPINVTSPKSSALFVPPSEARPELPDHHVSREPWRTDAPPMPPMPASSTVVPLRTTLPNGLTLLTAPRPGLPLVHVELIMKWGARDDRPGYEGESLMTATLMRQGAGRRSAQAFADAIETLGADIEVTTGVDATRFNMTVLKDNLPAALDLLADTLLRPQLREREFARTRARHLASLQDAEQRPQVLARRVFAHALYGSHPYGHAPQGTADSIARLRLSDLRASFRRFVSPALSAAIVVGDVTPEESHQVLTRALGGWHAPPAHVSTRNEPTPQPPQIRVVDKPGAPQSFVVVGNISAARNSPDRDALSVCNAILGGGFNSRINMNLREDKGWTYGAYSEIDFRRQKGPFSVATGVRTDVTGRALEEIFAEVDRIRATNVQDDELREVKSHAILSLPSAFATVEATATMLGVLFVHDLPIDHYTKLAERLDAVRAEDVRRVAMQYFVPDTLSVVVVGDLNKIGAELTRLGRGPLHPIDGHTLKPRASAPPRP